MNSDIRKSAIAGSWYPSDPKVLKADIERFFSNVADQDINGNIIGLVVPHAGYVYSGQIAAHAYKQIRGEKFDAVIVIGPSHHAYFNGVSVYDQGGYETPLGVVPIDVPLVKSLVECHELIFSNRAAHRQEHSVEIQLPFLQIALSEFRFVPLVMGDQSPQTCEILSECIFESIENRKVLIVGSSDLSHFHSYDKAVSLDHLTLSHILKMDGQSLLQDLGGGICEACGGGPIVSTMLASEKLGADNVTVFKYANSGDVTGDKRSVVGYASVIFTSTVS